MLEKQIEHKLLMETRKRSGLCLKFISPGWNGDWPYWSAAVALFGRGSGLNSTGRWPSSGEIPTTNFYQNGGKNGSNPFYTRR